MQDNTSVLIADNFYFDETSGNGEATGNVQFKDTAQGVLLFANKTVFNRNESRFKATEKPVLVVIQEGDSIYIAADTIYSAYMREIDSSRWTAPALQTPVAGGNETNNAPTLTINNPADTTGGERDKMSILTNPTKSDTLRTYNADNKNNNARIAIPAGNKNYSDTLRFIQA